MKFVAARKSLFEAVGLACEAIPARPVNPIMKFLKLTLLEGSRLVAEATDCEFGVQTSLEVKDAEDPDEILADAGTLYDVLKVSPDEELTLAVQGTRLTVRGERTDADVPTAMPGAYPSWAERPGSAGCHCLSASSLSRLLDLTSFAVAPSVQKYAINGVLFYLEPASDSGEANVTLVGTDCRAVAIATDAATARGEHHTTRASCVLPYKSARLLASCLAKAEDRNVEMTFTSNDAIFQGDGWALQSRLLEGQFPNWKASLTYKLPFRCKVEPGEMGQCLRQAAIFKEEGKVSRVNLTFSPDTLVMESSTQRGRSRTSMAIGEGGEPASVTVNADFVRGMLSRLPDKDDLTLSYGKKPGTPLIFSRPGFLYQVAPLVEADDDK